MITYQAGRWGVHIIFKCYGSVFLKAFVWAASAACIAAVWVWISSRTEVDELSAITQLRFDVLWSYDFVLGVLIVFRSQTAHSRWWEAGTLIQQIRGEWFNAYSNLIAFCSTDDRKKDEVEKFQQTLARLVSVLYGCALQQVSHMEDNNFDMLGISSFQTSTVKYLAHTHDRCEVVLQWIQRTIVRQTKMGVVEIPAPILSRVYQELSRGIVNLNNARKISEFPFPFPYAQMVMALLLIQWIMTPIVMGSVTSSGTVAGLLTFVQIFAFWAITYIAQELEAPYGDDPNDLPLKMMQEDMNQSLLSLLEPIAQEPPLVNLRGNLEPCSRTTLATVKMRVKKAGVLKSHKATALATTVGLPSGGQADTEIEQSSSKGRQKSGMKDLAHQPLTMNSGPTMADVPVLREPPTPSLSMAAPSASVQSGDGQDSNHGEGSIAMEVPRRQSPGTDQRRLPREQDRMPLKSERLCESGDEEDSAKTQVKQQESSSAAFAKKLRRGSGKPGAHLHKTPPDSSSTLSLE